MAEKSIIIIGAGLAGLSAGCYAQMNGYRSHIFEHHSKPGGVAAAWQRQGYLIDGGIHFLMGHRPGQPIYELYRELGTAQPDSLANMTTYGHLTDEVSGVELDVTYDLDKLSHDLKSIATEDARRIDRLISGVRAMQGSYHELVPSIDKPPELMSPIDRLKQLYSMRKMFKYFLQGYNKPVNEYVQTFHSRLLREIIANLFLPEVPVWFNVMILTLLADRQLGLLKEGCPGFVQPIEKRYKDLGGDVTYRATVKDILVENDHAAGIHLEDGSVHKADIVVSAADGYSTIFDMLKGRYVDKSIRERYQNWQLVRPIIMVSYGVARDFPDDPSIQLIGLENPISIGSDDIQGLTLRIFNYGDKFAPIGKTVVQVMFETQWDFWNKLSNDRPRYDAEKQRVADEVLSRIEAHYPGISSLVEVTDVATPYTTWRYTLNHRGAYMGWLPTPEAIMTEVPRTLPGLANFYMAGQWVMPGGGVPPSLYSGRHVVQILCRRDGKRFSTTTD